MRNLYAVLVYLVSAVISWKFCAGYWGVGPVFAVACLLINGGEIKTPFSLKKILFAAASVLTYAFVYWVADKGWKFENDALDMLFGSMTAGVVLGSILLPFIHGNLFEVEPKRVRKVSLCLIVSWYFTLALSYADEILSIPGDVDYVLIAVALWQGIYLRTLKIPRN